MFQPSLTSKFQWHVSVALQLNSSPSRFCLQKLSAKQCLGHTFSQEFQIFAVFWAFWTLFLRPGRASLQLFVSEIAKAAFLFHVAEFYQFILWRSTSPFSSWESQEGLLAKVAHQGVDGLTRRYVAHVHERRSPE